MRLTAFILLTACLTASAAGHTQGITIAEHNAPITKILQEIKRQTGYDVFYNVKTLESVGKVSITIKNATLEQALDECFKNTSLTYTISDKVIVISKKEKSPNEQEVTLSGVETRPPPIDIHGRIVNETGDPLEGISVTVKGTTKATSTNANGYFELKGIDDNATLVVTGININKEEIKLNGKNDVVINTTMKVAVGQEVIINKGYYTEKQRLSVGNVSTVKGIDIQKQPVNNPLLALEGRVPGLEVTQVSGVPGSAVKVQIRGQNSFSNGNNPFFIVDGVPYSPQLLPGLGNILGQAGNDFQGNPIYGNPLAFINPADIESIEVLKDADATAIYGSRAANGAILITTKKGKAGKTKVDINAYTGWGNVTRKIDLLNLPQYLDTRHEAFRNDGAIPNPNSDFDLEFWDTTRYTNWQKYFIGGTARYNNIQASVSGGNNQVQYLIGGGYDKETTVFPGDFDDSKASVHFNITSTSLNQKFKILLTGSFVSDNNNLLQQDLTQYIYLAPDAPAPYNSNGTLNWALNSSGTATWDNPLTYELRKYKNVTTNLLSNAAISYQVMPGLEIRTNLGYGNQLSHEVSTNPLSSINPNNTTAKASSNFADNNMTDWIIEPQISYAKEFGKLGFESLIGGTFQANYSDGNVLTASDFISDALLENRKAASIIKIASTTESSYKYSAGFARLNFNWADKYLINLTGRRDGSSRFGPENRFHNFGAIGAGWIFNKADFFKKQLRFLDFGKIRGSYGTTGNDQIGDYRYLDLYYPTTFNYQGLNGLVANNLFNPLLSWEETKKMESGIELGFLNDRIYFIGSYFYNKSSNELVGYTLPSTTGFTRIDANQDALVTNKGLEFVLNAEIIHNKDFHWSVSTNATFSRNKLVSVGPNFAGNKSSVGHSLNSSYVSHLIGVDPQTGKYVFGGQNHNNVAIPDTFYFDKDLNPEYYGGFSNSLNYKGFQLDILIQFVKQIAQNNIFGQVPGQYSGIPNQPTIVLNHWQKIGDEALLQKISQNGALSNASQYAARSDAAYSDASFIRLKNVSLSYQIQSRITSRLHAQNGRIYIQCQNLLTLTNYKGSDPETRSLNSLPPLRVITTGIQISF